VRFPRATRPPRCRLAAPMLGVGCVPAHLARSCGRSWVDAPRRSSSDGLQLGRLDKLDRQGRSRFATRWGEDSRNPRASGYGGIAYRHIADNYIALFSRFIPCGVWEAIYIIDGLLANASEVQPDAIHADTQGQSLPVFGLAFLCGFRTAAPHP